MLRSWWRDPMQSAKRQWNFWWISANIMNWKPTPSLKIMKYSINSFIYYVRRTRTYYLSECSLRSLSRKLRQVMNFKTWCRIVSRIRFSWSSRFTTLAFSGILKRYTNDPGVKTDILPRACSRLSLPNPPKIFWKSCCTFKLDIWGSQTAAIIPWSRKSDYLALKIPCNLSSIINQMTTISS